ncbi:hypothetical protein [Bdellovibrio svalbardensis]|uniref:SGNH hydrolase-type esterase domain-containing protein n=1 Tax=Bdellovibrio svalbardensis TaxID=2972972 RepID=A0ABT6DKN1_9BACT|nr:hypothetical protein [Bdellovibrio svalbardensis]MDG0817363.1 hypothetical protein [Bdellovibrio svalbardensis]
MLKVKNKTTQYIFLIFASLTFFLGLVALFNFTVDPMCYYRCDKVDLNRKTQNVYYRSAQTAVANPDAEVIVVGSSRGERVPPHWVESVTGLKTINLSQGGSDVFLKVALLNIALEQNPKIKKVIWMADYFELTTRTTDIKTRLTPILRKYSGMDRSGVGHGILLEQLQGLIDHRTLEAGIEMSGKSYSETFNKEGSGDSIDYRHCQEPGFVGPTPPEMMQKKISESYAIFGNFWADEQNPIYWNIFENEIRDLSAKGIDVIINLAPFHPQLVARAKNENPMTEQNQNKWVERTKALADGRVKVLNYVGGIPNDDGSPRYWEDGAHPTCFGVIEMLKDGF